VTVAGTRIAALYDIHGNLPALEAVLRELRQLSVESIIIGGDVLPGPMPRQTLEALLEVEVPIQFICGNGDREVLAQMSGVKTPWYARASEQWQEPVRWTAQQLQVEHRRLLEHWPPTCQINVPGLGDVLFCHATPQNDTDIFTSLTPEERLIPVFEEVEASLTVCGHTHMQFDRMVGRTRVVNAGSIGMPFAGPGAYWLLMDRGIELRRTLYDLEEAAERIRSTTYPQAEQFAVRHVINPPSEKDMLAAYRHAELKSVGG
jgi:putative phosphoesterase